MKLHQSKALYSATDLLNFLGCTHATVLDIEAMARGAGAPKGTDDAYLEILKEKGMAHERTYLAELVADGRTVVEIDGTKPLDEKAELTRQAMRDGADVIYQGALTAYPWHGYSDFLLKVDTPSKLGVFSYEVADTKLARTAKPKHVVQLCLYSEMIALEQGHRPANVHIVLGDNSILTLRTQDFLHYCNRVRDRFGSFVAGNERVSTAERCPHCSLCHWSEKCGDEWEQTGNLRLVAGLSGAHATKLRAAGVLAIHDLAGLDSGFAISRIQDKTLDRMRSQARLQMVKRTTGENRCEVLPFEDRRGFARLPKPDEGDLFFDMEGDPVYSPQGSLEYLFGFHYIENGENSYKAFWARDKESERRAFENALDFITMRIEKYPGAFVYHYAAYEQTALKRLAQEYGGSSRQESAIKRLAQSYGTRENEVDDLLRNRKFVDLYKVVREAVRTSEPAYSLKNLEVFFAEKRTQEITSGGDSIVAFENWLKTGDDALLESIEVYNAFDCHATLLCRDWLLSLRPDGATWLDPEAERLADDAGKEEERRNDDARVLELRSALVDGIEKPERDWRELLGYLLEYHRREARSEWWRFFDRCEPAHDSIENIECIGGITLDPSHPPRPDVQSLIWRLRFPEQEFKFSIGDKPARNDTEKGAGTIFDLNESERWLEIRAGKRQPPLVDGIALVAGGPRNDEAMRLALRRYADIVIGGRVDDYPAVSDLLRKALPRIDGPAILPRRRELLDETIDAIIRMDRTYLVIQGPPGSGKTFTSAHAIVSLLEKGLRVGVLSMSHKAINNLLTTIEEVAAERGVVFSGIKLSSEADQRLGGRVIEDTSDNKVVTGGNHALIGGTSWLFSRPEMDQKLDYLFVDEAGQVSLANVVATGLAAKNIVLVGDQMQLAQPTKGDHPGGSGVSGLDYLMGDWATVPDDRGIFLEKTWRMHPGLCRFVSDAFYEGKLESAECTKGQMLKLASTGDEALAPSGLRFVAVEHQGNTQRSNEEATRLSQTYNALLGQEWVNEKGETHAISDDDILVVSPYNLQVSLLKRTLPPGARVGTVDKFQGQEAAVVLVSMASSSASDAPRGIDFLFSANRLNVALSRARCLSVIFCSPSLLDVVCNDLEGMKLVNTVCWAREFARDSDSTVFPATT